MENIFTKIASILATLTVSIMTFFTGPAVEPTIPPEAPTVIVESGAETNPVPKATTTTKVATPKASEINAYEIGKQVGYLQAITEVVEKEAIPKTPPRKDESENLPIKNQKPMTEEETKVEAPVSQARIDLFSSDKATGMGREYNAITDDKIERWDQASDYSNFVVIDLIVYNEEGKKESNADVKVTATDESQSKQLGGKQSYQYLFKTPGEHTITFEAYGATKSVTFTAK